MASPTLILGRLMPPLTRESTEVLRAVKTAMFEIRLSEEPRRGLSALKGVETNRGGARQTSHRLYVFPYAKREGDKGIKRRLHSLGNELTGNTLLVSKGWQVV